MRYPGFIGPAYSSRSMEVAGDRLVNLFLEEVEVEAKKAPLCLYGTPGSSVFCTVPQVPLYGAIAAGGRAFVVGGLKFYEVLANGTYIERAHLGTSAPVKMAFNGYQIGIAGGKDFFVYKVQDNTLSVVADFLGGSECSGLAFIDNYFIASLRGTREYRVSALNDGTSWDPGKVKIKEGAGDQIVTIFGDHRELFVLGQQTAEVHFDSGNADFPFERIQGAFIETGCIAENAVTKFDNSILWLGADERGSGIVWRANGYVPQRVSNHAMEAAMRSYSRIDDALAFTYQDQGHIFGVFTFPTANKTWVIDAATNSWHEREWWDPINGRSNAIRGRYYMNAFGKHLVTDFENGKVYELSMSVGNDFGGEIRRIRRAPPVWDGDKVVTVNRLSLILETGTADASPVAVLRVSKDGGRTFGNEIQAAMGAQGAYGKRVQFRRLGTARRWTPEVMITDSVPVTIAAVEVDIQEGS